MRQRTINNSERLEEFADNFRTASWLAFDMTTSGKDPGIDVITDYFISCPTDSETIHIPPEIDKSFVRSIFELIQDKCLVVYDWATMLGFLRQLKRYPTITVRSDVLVEAYITGRFASVDLTDLVQVMYAAEVNEQIIDSLAERTKYCGRDSLGLDEMSKGANQWHSGTRTYFVKRLHQDLYPEISGNPKLRRLHEIEMAILPIAEEMRRVGIRVDFDQCQSEYTRLTEEAQTLSNSFHGWLNRNFKITEHYDFNSPAQTAELLIDRLQIIKEVKTEKGRRSTSKKIFEGLRDTNPIVNAIYTYRELIKSCTGFYGLYPRFKGSDNRMHPRLLTCHVISGRTASADPNIQQIPKESIWQFIDFDDSSSDQCATCKSETCSACQKAKDKTLQTAVREVFVPREGHLFVEGDYSQIELMVLAGVSNEPKMLEAFQNGIDIHSQTAALIFSVPLNEVTKEQRQVGKTTNFRFNYGGGPRGLADQLGITLEQAAAINKAYSRAYPKIEAFAVRSARESTVQGYVETLLGRRRYMEEFQASDAKIRARGRRLAVNLQIQGGAADIAKIGLIKQDQYRQEFDSEYSCNTFLVNFVHDSFLWEVPIISDDPARQVYFIYNFLEGMKKALCFDVKEMARIDQFPQLKVDFKIGQNYQDMLDADHWLGQLQ